MSYPINYPTPQGANVQIFSRGGSASDWVKPQGASFVWFTLIGGGGNGATGGSGGGGSGAVTNFMCPAFLIPDVLRVSVSKGDSVQTTVIYQAKDGTGYTLLSANAGSPTSVAGAAMTANAFTAMGFFQSIAGQDGSGASLNSSSTTFLSGGANTGNPVTANYGYQINNATGIFQMQPIIVGLGSAGANNGAIGCGGGGVNSGTGGIGGPGLAVIITW